MGVAVAAPVVRLLICLDLRATAQRLAVGAPISRMFRLMVTAERTRRVSVDLGIGALVDADLRWPEEPQVEPVPSTQPPRLTAILALPSHVSLIPPPPSHNSAPAA